jgi:hypothetical protein
MQDNKCANGDDELPNYVEQCARTIYKVGKGMYNVFYPLF